MQEQDMFQDYKNQQPEAEQKKKKHRGLLLILILLLLLSAGCCGAWYYFHREPPVSGLQKELEAELGHLPGMSEDEIRDRLNHQVEEGFVNVSINTMPVFKNGRAKGDLNIENIPGHKYAMTVTIKVKSVDSEKYPQAAKYVGQTVLTTGLIEPGNYLANKKLDVVLPRGEYVCTAEFKAYTSEAVADSEDPEPMGEVSVQIVMAVQK